MKELATSHSPIFEVLEGKYSLGKAPWNYHYSRDEAEQIHELSLPLMSDAVESLRFFQQEGESLNDALHTIHAHLIDAKLKLQQTRPRYFASHDPTRAATYTVLKNSGFHSMHSAPPDIKRVARTAAFFALWESIPPQYLSHADNPYKYIFKLFSTGINSLSLITREEKEFFVGRIKLLPKEDKNYYTFIYQVDK